MAAVCSGMNYFYWFLVTGLSFTGTGVCIVAAIVIVVVAGIICRKWPFEEKSDFYEIIMLCCEAIIMSIVTPKCGIVATVLFSETALCFINCCMLCIIKKLCGEDVDGYILGLRKIDY